MIHFKIKDDISEAERKARNLQDDLILFELCDVTIHEDDDRPTVTFKCYFDESKDNIYKEQYINMFYEQVTEQ